MKVKVCGMTQHEEIYALERIGADYAGFIFYEKSPRYALKNLSLFDINNLKIDIQKVGVFVNADENTVLRTAETCALDIIQLHGDESPLFCEKIANYYPVTKVFRLLNDENIEWKINKYIDAVDYFLFDTKSVLFGGSGEKFDWNILSQTNIAKPFFLSGGIGANDINAIDYFYKNGISRDHFIALDINSKFEKEPGKKDIYKIELFIKAIKENFS